MSSAATTLPWRRYLSKRLQHGRHAETTSTGSVPEAAGRVKRKCRICWCLLFFRPLHHPVQDIPDDRPARRCGDGVLPENPVVVQRGADRRCHERPLQQYPQQLLEDLRGRHHGEYQRSERDQGDHGHWRSVFRPKGTTRMPCTCRGRDKLTLADIPRPVALKPLVLQSLCGPAFGTA
jgi:hypothetical protein